MNNILQNYPGTGWDHYLSLWFGWTALLKYFGQGNFNYFLFVKHTGSQFRNKQLLALQTYFDTLQISSYFTDKRKFHDVSEDRYRVQST